MDDGDDEDEDDEDADRLAADFFAAEVVEDLDALFFDADFFDGGRLDFLAAISGSRQMCLRIAGRSLRSRVLVAACSASAYGWSASRRRSSSAIRSPS